MEQSRFPVRSAGATRSCGDRSGPHRPPDQRSSGCLHPAQLHIPRAQRGRGTSPGDVLQHPRVPGQGWSNAGEGEGHGGGSGQAEGGERCSAKALHAHPSPHNGPLSVPVTAGTMSLPLPLLPERTPSPTARWLSQAK